MSKILRTESYSSNLRAAVGFLLWVSRPFFIFISENKTEWFFRVAKFQGNLLLKRALVFPPPKTKRNSFSELQNFKATFR